MDDLILTHRSALVHHRTPPLVHYMYERYPHVDTLRDKHLVLKASVPFGAIEFPLDALVFDKKCANTTKTCAFHVWSGALQPGMIIDTEWGYSVTSPLFTVLTLASRMSRPELTMLLHECIGTFAVYCPPLALKRELQKLIDARQLPVIERWRPMLGPDGQLASLWHRPPLFCKAEAERFADRHAGERGAARLRDALRDVHGEAASPFEVQAAMLLGMPSRRGGWGLGPFEHNKAIRLSRRAQVMCHQSICYIDLFVGANDAHGDIGIECQGNRYHADEQRAARDDGRTMALQSMGITTVPLRYEQISDMWRLEATAALVAKLMHKKIRAKTPSAISKTLELMRAVQSDWWGLGA